MKSWLPRSINSDEQGAVSVYLIIIVAVVFLFQAVLIDFVRVHLAQKESESLLKAALRSNLSAYDKQLRNYGLFGAAPAEAERQEIARRVLQGAETSPGIGSMRYVVLGTGDHPLQIQSVYTLADHSVFKQQILEEMKYKGPVEFTRGLADKFNKDVTNAIESGDRFSQSAEKIERLLVKREDHMDKAWEHMDDLHQRARELHDTYAAKLERTKRLEARVGSLGLEEIGSALQTAKDGLAACEQARQLLDASKDGEKLEQLEKRMEQLKATIRQLESDLQDLLELIRLRQTIGKDASGDLDDLNRIREALDGELSAAKQVEHDIVQAVESIHTESPTDSASASGSGSVNEVFEHLPLKGDDYYFSYQSEAASVTAMFQSFAAGLHQGVSDAEGIIEQIDAFQRSMNGLYARRKQEDEARRQANKSLEAQKEQEKKKAEEVLDKARKLLADGGGSSEDGDAYKLLQGKNGYMAHYLAHNSLTDAGNPDLALRLDQGAEKSGKSGFRLLAHLQDMLQGARNELYVNEYALTEFNYRTLEHEAAQGAIASLSEPLSHPLQGQEVEYILYGFDSRLANISAAYAEIYLIRLAVRTAEALTDPKKMLTGSPLLTFLIALAEGAVRAYADMVELIGGKQVEVMAKLPSVKLSYKDYLRLFLLLHSDNSKMMSRMQALIQLNTGIDLADRPVYIRGTLTTSLKLWFLPGAMKLCRIAGFWDGRVRGSRFINTYTAAVSYE